MKLGTFIMGCALALLACTFAGCDDRLEVRQAYDFSLSSWYLQEGIAPDETVEIRLTLDREGDYREASYRIGYIQLEGDGEVFAADGTRLVNRELTELSGIAGLDTTDIRRQVFTLFTGTRERTIPGSASWRWTTSAWNGRWTSRSPSRTGQIRIQSTNGRREL